MSEIIFDKDTVSNLKTDFVSDKDKFQHTSLLTYNNCYIKTSSEPLISQMKSSLDELYTKIETGYTNINSYWTEYMDASDSLETSFTNFTSSCSNDTVNGFLSGFVGSLKDNDYAGQMGVISFDEDGNIVITVGSYGLSSASFKFIDNCEEYGKKVTVKYYTTDENGAVSLTTVKPELLKKEKQLVEECEKEGISITINSDVRTVDEQDELYAQGRSKSGNVVTNAKGDDYNSDHQWGIAFDVYVNGENGENTYTDPDYEDEWDKVGEIGKGLGLGWGGDYETFVDKPHFYLEEYDTKTLKEEYGTPDKFSETWDYNEYKDD